MADAPALDHVGIQVSDYDKAVAFYDAALKPLGWAKLMEYKWDGGQACGYGTGGKPYLWLSSGGKTAPHVHIAFGAASRAAVDAFYQAAMGAGGTDNGPPGIREHYHANYYAAFVFDPDGHNIETVTHAPPGAAAKSRPARKTAAKRAPARKPAARKPAARKPAASRTTAKKASPKKPGAKSTARGKPAARRTAPRKPAGRGGRKPR